MKIRPISSQLFNVLPQLVTVWLFFCTKPPNCTKVPNWPPVEPAEPDGTSHFPQARQAINLVPGWPPSSSTKLAGKRAASWRAETEHRVWHRQDEPIWSTIASGH